VWLRNYHLRLGIEFPYFDVSHAPKGCVFESFDCGAIHLLVRPHMFRMTMPLGWGNVGGKIQSLSILGGETCQDLVALPVF
jgi:hypothetical protein